MDALATQVAGWLFISGALMLWLGWVLLPARIGTFFDAGDFARVLARFRPWIWLFRLHLFGYVVTAMALVALASLLSGGEARVIVWPAVAVAGAGLIVSALAAAFYYHFGAWGALDMEGKPENQVREFVSSLKVSTEYVTCLTRFGRVFFGFGQLALAAGLLLGGAMPAWVAITAALLGIAAMAVTMGLPDNLEYYHPVFHLLVLWLLGTGVAILGVGARLAG